MSTSSNFHIISYHVEYLIFLDFFLSLSQFYFPIPGKVWVAIPGRNRQPQEQRHPTLPGVCSLFVNLCAMQGDSMNFLRAAGNFPYSSSSSSTAEIFNVRGPVAHGSHSVSSSSDGLDAQSGIPGVRVWLAGLGRMIRLGPSICSCQKDPCERERERERERGGARGTERDIVIQIKYNKKSQ